MGITSALSQTIAIVGGTNYLWNAEVEWSTVDGGGFTLEILLGGTVVYSYNCPAGTSTAFTWAPDTIEVAGDVDADVVFRVINAGLNNTVRVDKVTVKEKISEGEYGPELVVNGEFDNNTGWVNGVGWVRGNFKILPDGSIVMENIDDYWNWQD